MDRKENTSYHPTVEISNYLLLLSFYDYFQNINFVFVFLTTELKIRLELIKKLKKINLFLMIKFIQTYLITIRPYKKMTSLTFLNNEIFKFSVLKISVFV